AHGIDLSHSERQLIDMELLEILETDLGNRFIRKIASCFEHLFCELIDIYSRNLSKRSRSRFIHRSAGRRLEQQGIGNNRCTEKTCCLSGRSNLVFLIHLIDNGRSTAKRLVSKINRTHRLQISDSVVIDDLKNFRLFNSVYRLRLFVMIRSEERRVGKEGKSRVATLS